MSTRLKLIGTHLNYRLGEKSILETAFGMIFNQKISMKIQVWDNENIIYFKHSDNRKEDWSTLLLKNDIPDYI